MATIAPLRLCGCASADYAKADALGFPSWWKTGEDVYATGSPSIDATIAAGYGCLMHSLCGAYPAQPDGTMLGPIVGYNPAKKAQVCAMRGPEFWKAAWQRLPGLLEATAKRAGICRAKGLEFRLYLGAPPFHILDGLSAAARDAVLFQWYAPVVNVGFSAYDEDVGAGILSAPSLVRRKYGRAHYPALRQGLDGHSPNNPHLHVHADGANDLIVGPGGTDRLDGRGGHYRRACWDRVYVHLNGDPATVALRAAALRAREDGIGYVVEFNGLSESDWRPTPAAST